jgi:hypothetical protein
MAAQRAGLHLHVIGDRGHRDLDQEEQVAPAHVLGADPARPERDVRLDQVSADNVTDASTNTPMSAVVALTSERFKADFIAS